MRRPNQSISDVIADAISNAMRTVLPAIERQIADMAVSGKKLSRKTRRKGARRARARVEITRWVADRRARRVPTFVIEMTGGLDTKKKIVAKYGANAAFEKGRPLPAAVASRRSAPATTGIAARVVKARPPVVRRATGR
jgi:hypothetical protein